MRMSSGLDRFRYIPSARTSVLEVLTVGAGNGTPTLVRMALATAFITSTIKFHSSSTPWESAFSPSFSKRFDILLFFIVSVVTSCNPAALSSLFGGSDVSLSRVASAPNSFFTIFRTHNSSGNRFARSSARSFKRLSSTSTPLPNFLLLTHALICGRSSVWRSWVKCPNATESSCRYCGVKGLTTAEKHRKLNTQSNVRMSSSLPTSCRVSVTGFSPGVFIPSFASSLK
mmetsp:Transcript_19083/g.53538  ORF Transcript_19083/g.53538 Transcript_19083/m.53538 type:complete len:229 (+) Transcript_19083:422-1108(+)